MLLSAAAGALAPTRGAGGAPLFGANFPAVGGLADELNALGLATPRTSLSFGGTFRYGFGPGFQLGYYGAGGGFETGNVFPDDIVKECDVGYAVHHFVGGYKIYLPGRLGVFAGGGAGVFQLTYTKTISNQPYRFGNIPFPNSSTHIAELEGVSWSAQAFVAPQIRINPWFAVGAEIGYIYMKIPDGTLTQAGVTTAAAPEIDMSGPFVRVGPMFNY